jgi:hypothetical protein
MARLGQLESKVARLESMASDVARLVALLESAKWWARTFLWLGLTVGSQTYTGALGRLLGELGRLFGRGLA